MIEKIIDDYNKDLERISIDQEMINKISAFLKKVEDDLNNRLFFIPIKTIKHKINCERIQCVVNDFQYTPIELLSEKRYSEWSTSEYMTNTLEFQKCDQSNKNFRLYYSSYRTRIFYEYDGYRGEYTTKIEEYLSKKVPVTGSSIEERIASFCLLNDFFIEVNMKDNEINSLIFHF